MSTEADERQAQLRAFFADSGLTRARFARLVGRDERTVRRWLTGESPVPVAVEPWLDRRVVVTVGADGCVRLMLPPTVK